jgi:radical SAM superfamily enzyme YgiQ (UPF0313 family)
MLKGKRVFLVYFDHKILNYMPLDVGYVAAYIKKQIPLSKIKIGPIEVSRSKRIKSYQNDAYKIFGYDPDVVIFFLDNVVWSGMFYEGIALQAIEKLKKLNPRIRIGVQSYKITDESAQVLLKKSQKIDFVIRGEPEVPMLNLFSEKNPEKIKGLTFRKKNKIVTNLNSDLVNNLSKIPSPYLAGIFDKKIKKNINQNIKNIYVLAARGCPYRCFYCFRSVKFEKVRHFSISRIIAEMQHLYKLGIRRFSFLDDTFMMSKLNLDKLAEHYKKLFKNNKERPILNIMTRPETLDNQTLKALKKIGVRTIQIGLQSINPAVQHYFGREEGYDFKEFERILKMSKKLGIKIFLDIIIGMPGDSLEYFKKTVNFAASLDPARIQIKQMYLNPDTVFYLNRKKYGIVSGSKLPRNVPFVIKSKGWSSKDFKEASRFAEGVREKKYPKTFFKIVTQFGYHFDHN